MKVGKDSIDFIQFVSSDKNLKNADIHFRIVSFSHSGEST
jgi:hypothetical protein